MPFTEDLSIFFSPDTPGYASASAFGGSSGAVDGLFDREYHEVLEMEGSAPAFICAESSVPTVAQGQTTTINGESWKVVNVRPDRTGVVVLKMQLQ